MSFWFFLTYIFKDSISLFIVICTSILCCCCCCKIADVKLRVWKAELLFISELHQTIEEFWVERLEGFVVSQLFCIEEAVSYSINLLVSQSVNQPVHQSVCQQVSWPVCQPVSLLASQSICPVSRSANQSVVFQQISQFSQLMCLSVLSPPPRRSPLNPCDLLWVVMDSSTYGRVAILSYARKHHCVHGVGFVCLFLCLFSQVLTWTDQDNKSDIHIQEIACTHKCLAILRWKSKRTVILYVTSPLYGEGKKARTF